jgi:hypothetical protein
MAEKTLLEFSAPNINNICIGPTIDHEFQLKPSLINMVQADLFSRKVHEDVSAHLQYFLEKGTTISIKDIPKETILLHLFPFSLKGRARKWFYSNEINTWEECSTTFLSKFFPQAKPMLYVENHQFPAAKRRVNSRGMGTFARIYIRLPSPRNKRMDALTKLLPCIKTKRV